MKRIPSFNPLMGEPFDKSINTPRKICCIAKVTKNGGNPNLFSITAFVDEQHTAITTQMSSNNGNGIPVWLNRPPIIPIMHII
jgi:hypothetical protein